MLSNWQISFGIAAFSLTLAAIMYFNQSSRGSVFSFHKGKEYRLIDSESTHNYNYENSQKHAGKFDHLFEFGVGKSIVLNDSNAGVQLNDTKSFTASAVAAADDIPKLKEYRGEFDSLPSAQSTGHPNLWNKPEEKKKDGASWTPFSFFKD